MKVAIAGTGNVAQYLIEELTTFGHDIVVLTRAARKERKYPQRETDYSVASLLAVLEDRDALIATVADFQNPDSMTTVHNNMIEACNQSKNCKTFIPSEWTLNVEDYPEQPMFLGDHNKELHARLKKQTDLRWTIVCNAWFSDYTVSKAQRHFPDLGGIWPMDIRNKVFTVYGPGTQLCDFTSARDVAKAVATMLDSEEPWDQYTYLSGDQMCWNELFALLKKRDPEWTSRNKPLADSINEIVANKSFETVFQAQFEIQSYAGALSFPKERVDKHRTKYFKELHFRTVEEILDAAAANPETIV